MKLHYCVLVSAAVALSSLSVLSAMSPRHNTKGTHSKSTKTKTTTAIADTLRADKIEPSDVLKYTIGVDGDTIPLELAPEYRHGRLTEDDFVEVASEMDVEVAAIRGRQDTPRFLVRGQAANQFRLDNVPPFRSP